MAERRQSMQPFPSRNRWLIGEPKGRHKPASSEGKTEPAGPRNEAVLVVVFAAWYKSVAISPCISRSHPIAPSLLLWTQVSLPSANKPLYEYQQYVRSADQSKRSSLWRCRGRTRMYRLCETYADSILSFPQVDTSQFNFDDHSSRVSSIRTTNIVLIVLVVSIVGLRLLARAVFVRKVFADDSAFP